MAKLNEKVYRIVVPDHQKTLTSNIDSFYRQSYYQNVIFVCDEGMVVKTHCMTLASASEFMAEMLVSAKDDMVCISLPGVNVSIVKKLLDYLHTGRVRLEPEEISDFIILKSVLKINDTLEKEPVDKATCKGNLRKKAIRSFEGKICKQEPTIKTEPKEQVAPEKRGLGSSSICPEDISEPATVNINFLDNAETQGHDVNSSGQILSQPSSPDLEIISDTNTFPVTGTSSTFFGDYQPGDGTTQNNFGPSIENVYSNWKGYYSLKDMHVKVERMEEESIQTHFVPNTEGSVTFHQKRTKKEEYVLSVSTRSQMKKKRQSEESNDVPNNVPAGQRKRLKLRDLDHIYLEKMYANNQNPTAGKIQKFSNEINLTEDRITKWFKERRTFQVGSPKAIMPAPKAPTKNTKTGKKSAKMKKLALASYQLEVLESEFTRQGLPNESGQKEIAETLNIPLGAVQVWYRNRHSKGKRGSTAFIEWEDVENPSLQQKEKLVKDLTKEQKKVLDNEYVVNDSPNDNTLRRISKNLGVSVTNLQKWYVSRRRAERDKIFKFDRKSRK